MAWRCTGETNLQLVNNLFGQKIITKNTVYEAMKAVDRKFFVNKHHISNAYIDAPQSIGYQATISAPHMHGMVLEALSHKLQPGMNALDVGSGSGYLVVCMALMVGLKGHVVGIEHVEELQQAAKKNIDEWINSNPVFMEKSVDSEILKTFDLITGDGRKGYLDKAPYDAIHVGAASPDIPFALIQQLRPGGRLICPVGPEKSLQILMRYDKNMEGDGYTESKICDVRYVPLTSIERQTGGSRNEF